jgi:hypothetical protein
METKMSETGTEGSALTHETRTYDPHGPKEIGALAAATTLGVKNGTMYGWLYGKKVTGERRGKTWFIPAAEMQRLLDLKERGVLEGTMRAGQGGGSSAARKAGMKGGKVSAAAKKERKEKVAKAKPMIKAVTAPEPDVERQVTLTVNQLRELLRELVRVQQVVAPLKMTLCLMED